MMSNDKMRFECPISTEIMRERKKVNSGIKSRK